VIVNEISGRERLRIGDREIDEVEFICSVDYPSRKEKVENKSPFEKEKL